MELTRKLATAVSLLDWSKLRAWPARCPLCGPSVIVQISGSAIGVRCVRCAASAITMSLVCVLCEEIGSLVGSHVYELSSRGPLLDWLRAHAARVTCSEYFDEVPSGETANGVECQDVQQLTYAAATFDLCTSTEVLEHVPDDSQGFAELHRVLRPGGRLVFSVPMSAVERTVERAVLTNGKLFHILPPEYHGDRIRGQGKILAYRNYGFDIVDRVTSQGFRDVRLVRPEERMGRMAQTIVVATA